MTPATAPDLVVPDFELNVEPNSKLEGLLAQLEDALAVEKEAKRVAKDLKDNIKIEVQALAPNRPRIRIKSKFLSVDWIMKHQESWTFDSVMLKAVDPKTWVQYATKRGTWYLEAVKGAKR